MSGNVCGHCGESSNFVPVQGIIFCGTCGRKVLPSVQNDEPSEPSEPTETAPPTASSPPKESSPKQISPAKTSPLSSSERMAALRARNANLNSSPVKTQENVNRCATPPLGRSVTAEELDDLPAGDTLSEDLQPMSVIKENPDKIRPELAMQKARSSSLSATKPPNPNRRLSGFVREAGLSPNTGAEKVFTLTKSKLTKIEQAIRQQVKKEAQLQAEQDHAILEMEIETARADAEAYERENRELKQTLDEVMVSFQEALDTTKVKKVNQAKQIEKLATERSQLRTKFEHKFADLASLSKESGALQLEFEKATHENTTTTDKLEKAEASMTEWKEKYDKLKTQASHKIRQAAVVYTGLKKSNEGKEDLVFRLRKEITEARTRAIEDESDLANTTHEVTELRKTMDDVATTLQEKVASFNQVQAQLSNAISQYNLLNANAEEINAVNERYKEQVVQMRGETRQLTEANAQSSRAELGMKRLEQNLMKLKGDNTRLKQQLVACTKIENDLKSQLEGKGIDTSTMSGASGEELEQYEQQYQVMQEALLKKEGENKELMSICEGLMSECEVLKQRAAGH